MRKTILPLLAFAATLALGQTPDPDITWKNLVPHILEDQVQIWTFPARLVRGSEIVPTAAFAGGTAALVAWADPPTARYFRNTTSFNGYNAAFPATATALATALAPVPFYVAGVFTHSEHAKKTALFSAEALADAEIVTTVFKQASDRLRPIAIPPHGDFADSWTDGGARIVKNSGSFPSGHTIAAFAVATIIARRYGEHRWVPYAAYGLAAAVGFSRLTLSAHFASDVFVGGFLGYSISRFSVLRE